MPTVAIVGSLDTKAQENRFVAEVLHANGVDTILIDTGVIGAPGIRADISREEVARAAGESIDQLVAQADRGRAVAAMGAGAKVVVADLLAARRIHGAFALGGTGGTSVAAEAFRDLPLGFPKLIVSTAASGNTEIYIRQSDLILAPSVADVAGLNRVSRPILTNAALAMAGMVGGTRPAPDRGERPLVAASMFGVTTPAVTRAGEVLTELGYEVIVFHMTGTGGRTLEALVRQGLIAGVLDLTTTELADHLVGGVFDAGPSRLTAAAELGIPQVVSVGALDMVNFGPPGTVPEQFAERTFYRHNPTTTLMRTAPDETAEIGRILARRMVAAAGPVTVFLPLGGISALAVSGGPFHDPVADRALFDAVRDGLAGSDVVLIEAAEDINDPGLATRMAETLHAAIEATAAGTRRAPATAGHQANDENGNV